MASIYSRAISTLAWLVQDVHQVTYSLRSSDLLRTGVQILLRIVQQVEDRHPEHLWTYKDLPDDG